MIDEKKLKQAKQAFKTLCSMLDEKKWHYEKDEDNLTISCGAKGKDLLIPIHIEFNVDRYFVVVITQMPFEIPEERRKAMAVAVSAANWMLPDGSFDYDFIEGIILYRMALCFADCILSKKAFEYLMLHFCYFADKYNDKFLMVAKSNMTYDEIDKFIKTSGEL